MIPPLLFHYTDINAMISILGSDSITLRATNIFYLNDPCEIKEGIEAVLKVEDVPFIDEEQFNNYYLTSFSSNEDELSMWGMYASNGTGCALAFDSQSVGKAYGQIAQCIYGQNEIQGKLKHYVNLSRTGNFTMFCSPQPTEEQQGNIKKNCMMICS